MRQTQMMSTVNEGWTAKFITDKLSAKHVAFCAWVQMFHQPYKCDIPQAKRKVVEVIGIHE